MIVIFALAATIAFGTNSVPGATMYHWIIDYPSLQSGLEFTTSAPRVDFDPLEGRPFTVRVRAGSAFGWSPFSGSSEEHVVDPLPGDLDFDGRCDLNDFQILLQNFGNVLP